MLYRIAKGSHSCAPRKLRLHMGSWPLIVDREVCFAPSCRYDLPGADRYDINKLFGVSSWNHAMNSARFGWRWNEATERIDIFGYVHSNGALHSGLELEGLEINRYYKLRLAYDQDIARFSVWTGEALTSAVTCEIDPLPNFRFGYHLWPYFGGNNAAPHDMDISMS